MLRDDRCGACASLAVDIVVRHKADTVRPNRADQNALLFQRRGERRSIDSVAQPEDDNVGLYAVHIDLRCVWMSRNSLREETSIRVIIQQPLRHLMQRDKPSRRQNASLPHAPTQRLAMNPRLL